MNEGFGSWLRAVLDVTPDAVTGKPPLEQKQLAKLMHVSPEKINSLLAGRTKSLSPQDAHSMANVLERPEQDILKALGYNVTTSGLTDDEREMLVAYRRLSGDLDDQRTALRVVRALFEPPPDRPQRRARRPRSEP